MSEKGSSAEGRLLVAGAVFEILGSVLLMERHELRESLELFAELDVESIDILDILTQFESRFSIPLGLDLPFLDRSFFEREKGHFAGGSLTASGKKSLANCYFLNDLLLESDEAKVYLLSISSLIDLAYGWAES